MKEGLVSTKYATRQHKRVRLLLLAGCACVLVVMLTHVAEHCHLLPGMGWGLPDSPGHFLDLFSAVAGVTLLLAAVIMRRRVLS